MSKIRLTYRAISDLDDIYTYSLDKWGETVADQYITDIEQSI